MAGVNDFAVFYLNQHSHLQAHERTTGDPLWSRELNLMNGWLHACGNRVIVGGWRGYTDIVALDATDGRLCWSRDARSAGLHSTRVHAGSKTLIVADPRNEQVVCLRLDDGHETFARPTQGWSDGYVDDRTGSVVPDAPAVVRVGGHEFLLIKSDAVEIQAIIVEPEIWSRDLSYEKCGAVYDLGE